MPRGYKSQVSSVLAQPPQDVRACARAHTHTHTHSSEVTLNSSIYEVSGRGYFAVHWNRVLCGSEVPPAFTSQDNVLKYIFIYTSIQFTFPFLLSSNSFRVSNIYLFIYGYLGSSLLHVGFL